MPSREKVSVCMCCALEEAYHLLSFPALLVIFLSLCLIISGWVLTHSSVSKPPCLLTAQPSRVTIILFWFHFLTIGVWWYSMLALTQFVCVCVCSLICAHGFDGWCVTSVWSQPFGGDPPGLEDALVSLYFTAYLLTPLAPRCAPPTSPQAHADRLADCVTPPNLQTYSDMWSTDTFALLEKSNKTLKTVC